MTTVQFKDRRESVDFYQNRYSSGYMGYWSAFEKERLYDLIKSLDLPHTGNALDFGCGRGIFTSVIKEALPGWNMFGCDISAEAIESAKQHFPGITFFVLGDKNFSEKKFEFIHSHHVLEHTFDEKVTVKEMSDFADTHATMLHSLPCNHAGSLEYNVSQQMKNGFDKISGKFFFEDVAHIRRRSATQTAQLFHQFSFTLSKDYYANQYYGAIKWVCGSNLGLVLNFTNAKNSVDAKSSAYLRRLRRKLLFTWFCFFASTGFFNFDRGKFFLLKKVLQAVSTILFFPVTLPVALYYNFKAKEEWNTGKEQKNGSDMFLIFKR